jgi:hypothetical protein
MAAYGIDLLNFARWWERRTPMAEFRRELSVLNVAALLAAGVMLAAVAGDAYAAGPPDQQKTAILMELFTSEGCSSCPPVDNWVAQVDAAQPLPNAQIIVLSEHVDYWDHDGWKDPFSSATITDRQKAYVQNLGLSDVYTPQIIVDGDAEVKPANAQATSQTLQKAAGTATAAVKLDGVTLSANEISGHLTADGSGQKKNADVFVAVALDKTLTDVQAGENNGRKLTNIAVVKQMVRVGKLEKGKSFDQPFKVKLWQDADPANLRVIAFVQESGPGRVLGAAMTKEIAKGQ